MARSN